MALFGLVTWRAATSPEPDYALHAGRAQELVETGRIVAPHMLFELLTAAVQALLPLSYLVAAVAVGTAAQVALALVLYRLILGEREGASPRETWAAAAWALALMLLGPISFFTWSRHQLYLGYIAPNVFHSPTMTLLKPLAVAWFWSVTRPRRASDQRWMAAAVLTLAATLAKPSFTVAFLPALAFWLVASRRLPRAVDRAAALASLVVGGAVLAVQAWARGSQPSLLVLAPFELMGYYSPAWWMPFLFLFSIAFPLCVSLGRWSELRSRGPLLLAWLVFAIAAGYGYLLAEAEPNTGDGNWLWSGQVALFVLLAQTLLFFRSRPDPQAPGITRARRLGWVVLALHLACGLAWYTAEVVEPHQWWFPFSESD